jgi:hypothetical protein
MIFVVHGANSKIAHEFYRKMCLSASKMATDILNLTTWNFWNPAPDEMHVECVFHSFYQTQKIVC